MGGRGTQGEWQKEGQARKHPCFSGTPDAEYMYSHVKEKGKKRRECKTRGGASLLLGKSRRRIQPRQESSADAGMRLSSLETGMHLI